jgi:triosephosphate isomerase
LINRPAIRKEASGTTGRRLAVGVSLKMYFGYRQTLEWCSSVRALIADHPAIVSGVVDVFVLPSFPFLVPALAVFDGTPVAVGAQDLHWEDGGSFTGEVSGAMLAELGCRYVEVGHAERRILFGDGNAQVALKVEAALRNGLCPIICIGENVRTPSAAATRTCLELLDSALSRLGRSELDGPVIVAYEPQWAIGADKPASPRHIDEVCTHLHRALEASRPRATNRVIYGGSAGPGLLERLDGAVDGLFLGRRAHDPANLRRVLDEVELNRAVDA